jgi:hypothetical protein
MALTSCFCGPWRPSLHAQYSKLRLFLTKNGRLINCFHPPTLWRLHLWSHSFGRNSLSMDSQFLQITFLIRLLSLFLAKLLNSFYLTDCIQKNFWAKMIERCFGRNDRDSPPSHPNHRVELKLKLKLKLCHKLRTSRFLYRKPRLLFTDSINGIFNFHTDSVLFVSSSQSD